MKTRLLLSACMLAALSSGSAASAQGWYVSVLGGPTIGAQHINIGAGAGYPNTGLNAGGRIGYTLDGWMPWSGFALEGDVLYRQSHLDGSNTVRLNSLSGMGNLVYHVDMGWPVGAYVGAGAGAVTTGIRSGLHGDESTVFGWQALAGLDHPISPDTALFAEYRYQNAHNANLVLPNGTFGRVGNTSNNVSVGLKFDL